MWDLRSLSVTAKLLTFVMERETVTQNSTGLTIML